MNTNIIDITDLTDKELDALMDAPRCKCSECGATNVGIPYTHMGNNGERIDYRFEDCACGSDLEGAEWA